MLKYLLTSFLWGIALTVAWPQDVVKVLTYNVLNYPNANNNDPFGNDAARAIHFREIMEHIDPDIILLQELRNLQGADLLLDELNSSTSLTKTFGRATALNTFDSSGGNMIFFATEIFSLVSQTVIPVTNTTQAPDGAPVETPRPATIFQLVANPPSAPQDNITMYFVSVHLKGGNDSATPTEIADWDRRALGVRDIMDYINANLTTADIIVVAGDMNFYGASNEPGYSVFTTDASYPVLLHHPPGNWFRNSNTYVDTYTQSTRTGSSSPFGNSGSGGGLDDRFDLLLFSENLLTQNNAVTYVGNSYEVVGNTGNLNGDVTSGNSPIKNQLLYMSDHHPVALELELKGEDTSEPTCGNLPISDDCMTTTIEFTNFNGSGFSANPQIGELCSQDWTLSGFTDSYQSGGENTSGDFARGATDGAGESQGGIYSRNGSIWIQPTGSDFTPGELVLQVCNTSVTTLEDIEIAYDLTVLNDEPRGNSFDFSYSFDKSFFQSVPGLDYTSPATEDGSTTLLQRSFTLENAQLAPEACLYLRWSGSDVNGSGARDEFGLDNIKICSTGNEEPSSLRVDDAMIPSGTYGVIDTIFSSGTVAQDSVVIFEASTVVILEEGFTVEDGGTLTARIVPPAPAAPSLMETAFAKAEELPVFTEKKATLVNVFPNPANDIVTIQLQLPTPQKVALHLQDAFGKSLKYLPTQILEQGWQELQMELQGIPAGIYYLVLQTENEQLSQKLFVL